MSSLVGKQIKVWDGGGGGVGKWQHGEQSL